MKLFIGLIIAFLIFIYVYTFIKIRKKRKKSINKVDDYRRQYVQRKKRSQAANYKNSNYETYISKYNSQMDYIEKNQLKS